MKGDDVLRIAKNNGIVVAGNFPSANGVAVLGDLSDHERQGLQLQVSATMAAEISYRYPANIEKSEDSKSVNVDCTVFVFSPSQLINFVNDIFVQVKVDAIHRGQGG